MAKFSYKDTIVHVRQCTFKTQNHDKHKICWCCNKEFKDNEICVILINNYKHIPNMILHKKCFNEITPTTTDDLYALIESDYRTYKRLDKIFG